MLSGESKSLTRNTRK